MSLSAQRVAEMLALPEEDRAYLARELIASLDPVRDPHAETQWMETIDRRTRDIAESRVVCQPVEEMLREIRSELPARRQSSGGAGGVGGGGVLVRPTAAGVGGGIPARI